MDGLNSYRIMIHIFNDCRKSVPTSIEMLMREKKCAQSYARKNNNDNEK